MDLGGEACVSCLLLRVVGSSGRDTKSASGKEYAAVQWAMNKVHVDIAETV